MALSIKKFGFFAAVLVAVSTGCQSPEEEVDETVAAAGSAGTAGSANAAGSSGSSVVGSAGNTSAAGMAGTPSGAAGQASKPSESAGAGGSGTVNPCDYLTCKGVACVLKDGKASCESVAQGTGGSASGSGGSSGTGGSPAVNPCDFVACKDSEICMPGSTTGCSSATAGYICGDLICKDGIWAPKSTGSAGSGGSSGTAGAGGSSGTGGSVGTAGSGGSTQQFGEVVVTITIAFKEVGAHKLDLYAFEAPNYFGSQVWGVVPNFSGTDTRIATTFSAHIDSEIEFNAPVDGSWDKALCFNQALTQPMWLTYQTSDGVVHQMGIPVVKQVSGGCHIVAKVAHCGTAADPDCDNVVAPNEKNETVGIGQAFRPNGLEAANDSDDFDGDGKFDPLGSSGGTATAQKVIRMNGAPDNVTATLYDVDNWSSNGYPMTKVASGVYDALTLPGNGLLTKRFYILWTPSVNGENSSAGEVGNVCVSNVASIQVYNKTTGEGNGTLAGTVNLGNKSQSCHWIVNLQAQQTRATARRSIPLLEKGSRN